MLTQISETVKTSNYESEERVLEMSLPAFNELPMKHHFEQLKVAAVFSGFADTETRKRAYRVALLCQPPQTHTVTGLEQSLAVSQSEAFILKKKLEDEDTIEKDAIRTHGAFEPDGEKLKQMQTELKEILKRVTFQNGIPGCRYNQGMNEIAAVLQREFKHAGLAEMFYLQIFRQHLL